MTAVGVKRSKRFGEILSTNFVIVDDFIEKAMFSKPFRHAGRMRVDNMDEYLQSMGLWRKVIPKDGASLYRVVAEQVRSYRCQRD